MEQNGSVTWPWVTNTIPNPRRLTPPDCPGDPFSFPPPVHAAPKRASTSRTPAHFRRIIPPPFLRGDASSRVPPPTPTHPPRTRVRANPPTPRRTSGARRPPRPAPPP